MFCFSLTIHIYALNTRRNNQPHLGLNYTKRPVTTLFQNLKKKHLYFTLFHISTLITRRNNKPQGRLSETPLDPPIPVNNDKTWSQPPTARSYDCHHGKVGARRKWRPVDPHTHLVRKNIMLTAVSLTATSESPSTYTLNIAYDISRFVMLDPFIIVTNHGQGLNGIPRTYLLDNSKQIKRLQSRQKKL